MLMSQTIGLLAKGSQVFGRVLCYSDLNRPFHKGVQKKMNDAREIETNLLGFPNGLPIEILLDPNGSGVFGHSSIVYQM